MKDDEIYRKNTKKEKHSNLIRTSIIICCFIIIIFVCLLFVLSFVYLLYYIFLTPIYDIGKVYFFYSHGWNDDNCEKYFLLRAYMIQQGNQKKNFFFLRILCIPRNVKSKNFSPLLFRKNTHSFYLLTSRKTIFTCLGGMPSKHFMISKGIHKKIGF